MNKNIAFTHLLQPLMSTLTPLRRAIQHGACTQCTSHDLVSDLLRLDFGHGFLETLQDLHLGLSFFHLSCHSVNRITDERGNGRRPNLAGTSVLLSVDAVHTRAFRNGQWRVTIVSGQC